MEIKLKHNIGDLVWYIQEGGVSSAKILSVKVVVNSDIKPANESQEHFFNRFGEDIVEYATCHGEFKESQLFSCKKDLLESL